MATNKTEGIDQTLDGIYGVEMSEACFIVTTGNAPNSRVSFAHKVRLGLLSAAHN